MAEESPAPTPPQPPAPASRRGLPPAAAPAAVTAVVVLALVAAYVLGAVNHRPDTGTQRGVLVTGRGSVTATPDELTFTVTVEHRAADVSAAMDATNADTRKVLAALDAQGVAKEDVQTRDVAVDPTYDMKSGEQVTGYTASQQLSVTVRHLATAGAVISAAAAAAGNASRIGDVAMGVADKTDLEARARARAVRDARRTAGQYAAAAGRDLGTVLVVEEESATAPPVPVAADLASGTAGSVSPTPISAGTQRISVRVTVRFAFA